MRSQSRRIRQHHRPAFKRRFPRDNIPSCSRLIENNGTLIPQQSVDQARFPDIRASGQYDTPRFGQVQPKVAPA